MPSEDSPLVLVTGAAKRVGAEIVRAFARQGARVIIHYGKSRTEAESLLAEIGGTAKGHSLISFDLSNVSKLPEQMKRLPADLSILVNNASVFRRTSAPKETAEDAETQYNINFHAPCALMKAFFEYSESAELSVVNLLDQAVFSTPADSFSYILSKKMLAEATRLAARQYAPRMRVNGIAPGPVYPPAGLEHLKMAKTLSEIPLGRSVSPQDLAKGVVFLAENRSMTGSILTMDCGQSLL